MNTISQSQVLKINYLPKIKSVFISNGKSKLIIARQFTQLTHIQLQALHSSFIRCLTTSTHPNHSMQSNDSLITTQGNRFLSYQFTSNEKDSYYFVLITSVEYNIIEAEALLKLIVRFILETINYKYIQDKSFIELIRVNAFDIILGLDEMINPILGNEKLSSSQIISNLRMESIGEKEYKRIKTIQIEKAHDDLIKGMEEIDKMKYENKYNPGSISNEDVSRAKRDEELLLESKQMAKELEEEREREKKRTMNMMRGMNLNRHFFSRMNAVSIEERESMASFVNVCEDIVQSMMMREINRMNRDEDGSDDDNVIANSTINAFTSGGRRIIIAPIQLFYSPNDNDDDDNDDKN